MKYLILTLTLITESCAPVAVPAYTNEEAYPNYAYINSRAFANPKGNVPYKLPKK
jgi:hypothetical protein